MSLALSLSRALFGLQAPEVQIETHLSSGLSSLNIVGLAEMTVKESKDRVRSALLNANFEFPFQRVTINLAPADLPKGGSRFDLAIALGILTASKQLPHDCLNGYEFIGELGLDGSLRPVKGILSAAIACRDTGRCLIVPTQNQHEAALVEGLHCLFANSLLQVCQHLTGNGSLSPCQTLPFTPTNTNVDMSDVIGQSFAKRGCEIAAAGGHNLLLFGSPGTGKSLLAQRFSTILPPMTEQQALETASIQSLLGALGPWRQRPFQSPHHSASPIALCGGGTDPKPGAISLAHNGVLFLDEFPEFQRMSIEMLREPIETGSIHIARAKGIICYPARFQLFAAMNPCPCGFFGNEDLPQKKRCRCTTEQIQRYRSKISGPILDRIDIHIGMENQSFDLFAKTSDNESSEEIQKRVTEAWLRQHDRQKCNNAALSPPLLVSHVSALKTVKNYLNKAVNSLNLSPRSAHRIMRVALTIADLNHQPLAVNHLQEALAMRQFEH